MEYPDKKICTKCGVEKPLDEFRNRHNQCCECEKEYCRKYRRANKEYFKKYNKKWYENNKEYTKEYHKKRYEDNREYYCGLTKKWVKENKKRRAEYNKKHHKEFYKKNKKDLLIVQGIYRGKRLFGDNATIIRLTKLTLRGKITQKEAKKLFNNLDDPKTIKRIFSIKLLEPKKELQNGQN